MGITRAAEINARKSLRPFFFASLVCWCSVTFAAINNPSFENGLDGWQLAGEGSNKDSWQIIKPGMNSAQALEVVSKNRFAPINIGQGDILLPDPSKSSLLSFDCKFSSPLFKRCLNVVAEYKDAAGKTISPLQGSGWALQNGMILYLIDETRQGDWTRRTYILPAVKDGKKINLQLGIGGGEGSLLCDNFELKAADEARAPEKCFYYNPFAVPIGKPPFDHFLKLIAAKSPFLKSSDRFNYLMVAQSKAQETLERLERVALYLEATMDTSLAAKNEEILRKMAALYETYGRLYLAHQPEKLNEEFDKPVEALGREIETYGASLLEALVKNAVAAGLDPEKAKAFERELPPKLIEIDNTGKPNQLLLGIGSKPEHFEMERALGDIERICWIPHDWYKISADHKSIVFPGRDEAIKEWSARGVEYFNVVLPFDCAGQSIVAPDFFENNWSNADIYMQADGNPGKIEPKPTWTLNTFNIFNPAVVEATRQAALQFGDGLKNFRKIYTFTWESGGPNVGGRLGGYGVADRKTFQAYLKDKFATVDNLNRTLKTSYVSFEEIQQPPDEAAQDSKPPPVCNPLAYEFKQWAQRAYENYCRTVYKAIKERDPAAIVISDHTGTFGSLAFDPMTVFEYADMVSGHAAQFHADIYRSLLKYAPNKTLGAFEDQWALRESPRWVPHRPSEEALWRNYLIKHVGQLANQDLVFDSWWYSYTRQAYVLMYGSPHWAHPAYDLSTFRYFVTGVPTGIKMVRRIEDTLLNTRKAPSRIALLIPSVSMCHNRGCNSRYEIRSIHNLLYPLNYTFDAVTEPLLLSGRAKLSDFEILIVPFAPYFPKGLWDMITPWIKAGGTLISVGPAGLYDEYGFDDPASLVKPLMKTDFPPNSLNQNNYGWKTDWGWDNGAPIREQAMGKGKIMLIALPTLGLCRDNNLLDQFLQPFKTLKLETRSADTPVELTLRQGTDQRCSVFALNSNGDATLNGTIEVLGRYEAVKDLSIAAGFPVKSSFNEKTGYTAFRFRLAPGAFTLYSLGQRR